MALVKSDFFFYDLCTWVYHRGFHEVVDLALSECVADRLVENPDRRNDYDDDCDGEPAACLFSTDWVHDGDHREA